jgi:Zn-dependent metalloprotease
MISGDGDGELFNRFTIAIDVTAKEFASGIVQAQTKLVYWQQSGAFYNSIASVFACLVKRYVHQQTADQADWILGAGLFTPKVKGKALSSAMRPTAASLLCASKRPASSIAPFSAVAGMAGMIVTRNT